MICLPYRELVIQSAWFHSAEIAFVNPWPVAYNNVNSSNFQIAKLNSKGGLPQEILGVLPEARLCKHNPVLYSSRYE